ncbi:MAG TPA: hypothetical protein VG346_11600 [Acidimicrobiales bacterium]|nr:hypothetical protein [Acidimicrobiales bacterium]
MSNQAFTTPGAHTVTLPSYGVTIAARAVGGSGASGGGASSPDGNAGIVDDPNVTLSPGTVLKIFVGAQGGDGSNNGDCAGGGGGGGNEVGKGGGQGGQCSYVEDVSDSTYLLIAAGGGGSGGEGGGGGPGAGGGTGGATTIGGAFATGFGGLSSGAGGGGPGSEEASPANGAGGSTAGTASDAGGGGGGGGGAGAGNGGGSSFEGGGGGAGGDSYGADGGDGFGTAPNSGNGSVSLTMSAGTLDTSVIGTATGTSGETQFAIPADASAVTILEEGTDGQGGQGGAAGLVMQTLPISSGSFLTPGLSLDSDTDCAGGTGGGGFNGVLGSGTNGASGGSCGYVRFISDTNGPQLVGVAGGGGGTGGSFAGDPGGYGGSMGGSGGIPAFSSGGSVGTGGADNCDLGVVPEHGGNGAEGSSGAGSGGGGGGGGGGGCSPGGGGAGGINVGGAGGGGGSNYVTKASGTFGYSDVASYTPNTDSFNQIEFIVGVPPVITTADSTVFTAGSANSFTVGAPGVIPGADPPTALSESGNLPQDVSFTDNGDGTATLSGNPPSGAAGTYVLTITSASALTSVSQAFTLTVQNPPTITSANNAAFSVQQSGDFTVTTSGFPAPTLSESGALPTGVTFTDNANGTATLGGPPAPGTDGTFTVTITAGNKNLVTHATQTASQTFTLTVSGQGTQAIGFSSTATTAETNVGDNTYAPTASGGGSGNPVVFSIDTASASECSITGGIVDFTAAGTCNIDANQAGNSDYLAAPQAVQSITVGKGSPLITFIDAPPSQPTPNTDFLLGAIARAGGVPEQEFISFSVDPASTDPGCQLLGPADYALNSTVDQNLLNVGFTDYTAQFVEFGVVNNNPAESVGTCIIDANNASDSSFGPAPQVQIVMTVKSTQSFADVAGPPPVAGAGSTYTLVAISTANTLTQFFPTTFSLDGSSSGCSLSPLTAFEAQVSMQIAGDSCVVDANQPGDADVFPAPQIQFTTAIRTPETVSLSAPPTAAVGSAVTVSAIGSVSSPSPSVTVDPATSPAGACTLSDSSSAAATATATVTFIDQGTCVLDANLAAASSSFAPAPQAQQTITIGSESQTISFTSTPPAGPVPGSTYAVSATSTSGETPTLSVDPASSGVCTLASATVTANNVGSCQIDASVPATGNYAAASGSQTFAVGPLTQTISFITTAPGAATANGTTYTPSATSTSGATPTIAVDPTSTNVCSIASGVVSFQEGGTCILDASLPPLGNYGAAATSQYFSVAKEAGTIQFTTSDATDSIGHTYAPHATANSGATVTFSIDPGSSGVCGVSSGTVAFQHAGLCTIDASAPATASYTAATASQEVGVDMTIGSIHFTSTPPSTDVTAGPTYAVSATANSGAAVAYTSDTPAVCSVSGSTVAMLEAGTCTVRASAPATSDFTADTATQSFDILTSRTAGEAVASTPDGMGYWVLDSDGDVTPYGTAGSYGSLLGRTLNAPPVGLAATPDGKGYWIVASDGGIFAYGDAGFYGSAGAIHLNQPIVHLAATSDGRGYWLVARDGGIFAYGDAEFWGSAGSLRLNQPVVDIAPTPDGAGYWIAAADGGVFTYGDAPFEGSMAGTPLTRPITGMAATPSGGGYWMVASDGGVFSFGGAPFYGSLAVPVGHVEIGLIAAPDGGGYSIIADDGQAAHFGSG